ncbi:MAG: hypothetical protein ACKPKO_61405, partial [Candidatus Fonsibacter sp.]
KVTEMTTDEADEQKGYRIYSGTSLNRPRPETWEHNQYRLTMTMLDTFDYEEDDINVIATTIYRHMRSPDFTPDDIILGTVFISNETIDNIIDFTKEDLTYICKQAFQVENSKAT